nr:hypothetical protein [Tanacetum cinerariifolium]
ELYKIVKDETFPIVNQVYTRVQNFEIQFLKEATKFVGDFKSLANETDASLAKHKALELDIEHLQTELERTKERFENCIIKKENKYAKLWNDWNKKCDECKYDKISYDKAYKDMQQKIEWLQAQLGDLKVSTPQESKAISNDKVIAPGMFRINPFKTFREEKHVPNTVSTSVRTKPITVSQPSVFTKKDVNSDLNGLSSTGKHKANVSFKENQKKHQPRVRKPKKVGFLKRLATPKPRKPRFLLRWSLTGRLFDQKGNIADSSKSESQSDCSNGYLDLFVVRPLGLFQSHDWKSKASYQFRLEVYGNCPLRK